MAVLSIAALTGTLIAVINTIDANHQRAAADHQHDLALSRQLAAQGHTLYPTEPAIALRLATAAWAVAPTNEARNAMISLATQSPGTLIGHTDTVTSVAFNHDGTLLATASYDNTVRLWNPTTGQPTGTPLTGHTDWVTGVAFNHDGTLLATTSDDNTVRLWNPALHVDPLPTICAQVGPPTQQDWDRFAPGEPLPHPCP